MRNIEMIGFGATKIIRGLLLIITLGFCDVPYDMNYALWLARRRMK
jgi:hypothetical protein